MAGRTLMGRCALRTMVVLGMVLTLVGGAGVFAIFTDQAAASSNSVVSGALAKDPTSWSVGATMAQAIRAMRRPSRYACGTHVKLARRRARNGRDKSSVPTRRWRLWVTG